MNRILLTFAAIFSLTSVAQQTPQPRPTQFECTYAIYRCYIVNGHCFGPPPPHIKIGPLPLKPDQHSFEYSAEIGKDLTVNNRTITLEAKGEIDVNGDGSVVGGVSLKLTDSNGLSISSGGDSAARLSWVEKNQPEWLGVDCDME